MAEDEDSSEANFALFRDCVFNAIVERTTSPVKPTPKKARHAAKGSKTQDQVSTKLLKGTQESNPRNADPSELVDFSDYLASEAFPALPEDLRFITHQILQDDVSLSDKWSLPLSLTTLEEIVDMLPGSLNDSLEAYGLIEPPATDVQTFVAPIIAAYLSSATAKPPKWSETRATECEICEREHLPLTYHHLIPRAVHAKVLKRGWHEEQQLNSVAWLCRACHTFVHRMASNEELAKEWFTVDKICSRDDVQKWADWVGRIRWKKR